MDLYWFIETYFLAAPRLETIGVMHHHSLLEVLNVKLAYMPSCIPPEVHVINVFFVVIVVKKCIMASSRSRFFVLHRSKILLVLATKVTYLRILCSDSKMELKV